MTMIDPATGWFEIGKVPTYDLDDITGSNYEYIDKSSVRVRQFLNNKCLSKYLHPRKVVFEKVHEFKWNVTPFLKGFNIKPVLAKLKTQKLIIRWSDCTK